MFIKAISYYLPFKVLTNEDLIEEFPEWSVEKVAKKVGVNQRHIAGENETAGDMAFKAAQNLFQEYNISPKTIDFVLLCTQSPDYFLPSTACVLQHKLGIPSSAGAFDFNLGCSGCVYGMAVAKGLITAGIAQNVLLLTSETYTKYLHPEDKGSRSIFGDGAAACLISTEGFAQICDFVLGTDGERYDNLILETGAARKKEKSNNKTVDENGNVRYDDYLYMDGGKIFNFTVETIPQVMEDVLKKNNIENDKIDYYIFHQANKYMLSTIRKICQLPSEKFYINLEETGNTVSSTILIGLKDCIANKTITDGMNVLIAGFGVGLSWGATVLKF